jgi:hypothetical protein
MMPVPYIVPANVLTVKAAFASVTPAQMLDLTFLKDLPPILQFLIGIPVVLSAVYLMFKAQRDKLLAPSTPSVQNVRSDLHFEGPLEALLKEVRRMATALEKFPTDRDEFRNWTQEFNTQFSEVRSKLYNEIDRRAREETMNREKLEERVRQIEIRLGRARR